MSPLRQRGPKASPTPLPWNSFPSSGGTQRRRIYIYIDAFIQSDLQPLIHSFTNSHDTAVSTMQGDSQLVRSTTINPLYLLSCCHYWRIWGTTLDNVEMRLIWRTTLNKVQMRQKRRIRRTTLNKVQKRRIRRSTLIITKFETVLWLPWSNFMSQVFSQVLKQLAVSHVHSSVYHPESQGALEQFQHLNQCCGHTNLTKTGMREFPYWCLPWERGFRSL